MVIILFLSLLFLVIIGTPISFAIGISSLLTFLATLPNIPLTIIPQRIFAGIDTFPLMCIPFFVIAGEFMSKGNISQKLIDVANIFVGRITGGLAHINILSSMFFGGVSGSATADVSSIGTILIPTMSKAGYDDDFSVAVTATSATIGMIIPPSNAMIIYSTIATSVSISSMFLAGIIPGILVGLSLMIVAYFISKKRGYQKEPKTTFSQKVKHFLAGILPMFTFIIILGGILGGIFTPTESAVVAALYSFILSVFVYKSVKLKDVPEMMYRCAITTAAALFLIAVSSIFGWLLAYGQIPSVIASLIFRITSNKYLIYILILIVYLIVGTFLDMTPALIIFVPIFLPIVQQLGMDAVQFGLLTIVALCIGLYTPPVGAVLFLTCRIGNVSLEDGSRAVIPFMLAMILICLLIIFVKPLTMFLPTILS